MSPTPRRRSPRHAPLALALIVLAGCAATGAPSRDDVASDRPMRTDPPAEPIPSVSAPGVVGEVPDALLAQILADAADGAGIDIDDVEVVRAEAVTWNDGSLGCPEPDVMYTQALVDGYHVVLEADGTELDYRATANGDFRRCENPGRPSGG
jgi:hypothetical protein